MKNLVDEIAELAKKFSAEHNITDKELKLLIGQAMIKAAILTLQNEKEIEKEYFEKNFQKQ